MNEFNIKNIKTIIGLGNPGIKYSKNRHNIGFRIVDRIAKIYDAAWKETDNLKYCDIQIVVGEEAQKIFLIKPQTFMNTSGKVNSFLLKKGINPQEILVVHDELEKSFGKINIKFGGSAKGHNGLRSIIGVIGKEFWRLQFGIGRPERKEDVGNYVLSNFILDEERHIDALIEESINLLL